MINKNFHAGNTLDCMLFQKVMKFKNIENLSELYSRLSDLIVEMIQGTDAYVKAVTDPEMIVILTRILKSQM